MTEPIYWNRLSALEKRDLWKQRHPVVPPGFLPYGCLPWEQLSATSRLRCYKENDPRVPPGWTPEQKPTRKRLKPPGSDGRGEHKRLLHTYLEPEAVVIELSPELLAMDEKKLWEVLLSGWDEQGISPRRVTFRHNGRVILTLPNPHPRSGKLPFPVLK